MRNLKVEASGRVLMVGRDIRFKGGCVSVGNSSEFFSPCFVHDLTVEQCRSLQVAFKVLADELERERQTS